MTSPDIAAYVDANAPRFLEELQALVAIPSVSTLPEHRGDVRRAAEFLVEQLRESAGLASATLIETAGHPLVYAESEQHPDQPTVLIYGHYDVQPVDPIALWRTPPFEATVEGQNLRGRGVVDDKGPMLATIKALETLQRVDGKLPVNVKVLLEGEEEMGSESISKYVNGNPAQLRADCALVLDTIMEDVGIPTLCYGLRGLAYFEITATGAPQDLHSGLYGGIAPNPLQALAWVLADLKGRDGRINIPGLYELMRPLSAEERGILERQSRAAEARLLAATGLRQFTGEADYSITERATARPTFEIHGIRGGFIDEGAKTVIPFTATAKVSLRLVPDQRPHDVARLLAERVRELTPPGVTIEVRELHGGDGVVVPLDAPVLQAAAEALEQEFNRPVEFVRMGGSIPISALFYAVLHQPVVMMGFGLPDDNFHAPNEKFYLPNYYAAIRSVAGFLRNMASSSRDA